MAKLKSTYADALLELIHPETGRIHTSFNQTVAATGRLSSSDPNLQNIPIRTAEGREIRKAFVPRKGWQLLSADYSQIELRILAHCSEDPILIQAFKDDEDIHTRTAAEVFQVFPQMITDELRRQAKAINFGIIYGMSAFGLARELEGNKKEKVKQRKQKDSPTATPTAALSKAPTSYQQVVKEIQKRRPRWNAGFQTSKSTSSAPNVIGSKKEQAMPPSDARTSSDPQRRRLDEAIEKIRRDYKVSKFRCLYHFNR